MNGTTVLGAQINIDFWTLMVKVVVVVTVTMDNEDGGDSDDEVEGDSDDEGGGDDYS